MKSTLIEALRSVALNVPDLALAERFYTQVWKLSVVARTDHALYFRGSGKDHHLLSLHLADQIGIRHVTLRARSHAALALIAAAACREGGEVVLPVADLTEPGQGCGLTIADADGRTFQVVFDDELHTDVADQADHPIRLAHAVLNCHDVEATRVFMERVFDFALADRTKIMAFMNCSSDHHTIALGDTDNDALNHIAFLMPDIDSVMRGGGRMRDANHSIEWGPGRHGPGDNAFNYFIGPFGEVIEYTAEVEQVDESYEPGTPDDWKWPGGRVDQWGISQPPSEALKEAQRKVFFIRAKGGNQL